MASAPWMSMCPAAVPLVIVTLFAPVVWHAPFGNVRGEPVGFAELSTQESNVIADGDTVTDRTATLMVAVEPPLVPAALTGTMLTSPRPHTAATAARGCAHAWRRLCRVAPGGVAVASVA